VILFSENNPDKIQLIIKETQEKFWPLQWKRLNNIIVQKMNYYIGNHSIAMEGGIMRKIKNVNVSINVSLRTSKMTES